ncbi:MAG: hypothetical protein QOH66_2137, partial [Actinomycetota bacterium]|nr:hypothetical protein [Actinomycetota bacterium]
MADATWAQLGNVSFALSIQCDAPNPAVPPTKNAETTRTDTSFGVITSILP